MEPPQYKGGLGLKARISCHALAQNEDFELKSAPEEKSAAHCFQEAAIPRIGVDIKGKERKR